MFFNFENLEDICIIQYDYKMTLTVLYMLILTTDIGTLILLNIIVLATGLLFSIF